MSPSPSSVSPLEDAGAFSWFKLSRWGTFLWTIKTCSGISPIKLTLTNPSLSQIKLKLSHSKFEEFQFPQMWH
jgi:hypothetical protein